MFCLLMYPRIAKAGHTLQWDGTTSAAFSAPSDIKNWYDTDTGMVVNQGNTTDYNGLRFVGAGTNSQDAPLDMSVGASTSFSSLAFANGFNSSNTTTIANGTSANYTFHIQSGADISDNASSGVVKFSKASSGTFKFDLCGATTVGVATGASIVFDAGTIIENETAALTGSVIKSGGGILRLDGANTFSDGTNVNEGTLLVNNSAGSGTGTGKVTVNNSGTLGGIGTIGGAVTIGPGGALNPGQTGTAGTAGAVGTINTGALTLQSGSFSSFDVSGTATYDQLISSGAIAFGGRLDVNIASGLNFANGEMLNLFTGTSDTGTFTGIADNQLVTFDGYTFMADYTGSGFTLTAVPEPST